jgi:hypothetical protein
LAAVTKGEEQPLWDIFRAMLPEDWQTMEPAELLCVHKATLKMPCAVGNTDAIARVRGLPSEERIKLFRRAFSGGVTYAELLRLPPAAADDAVPPDPGRERLFNMSQDELRKLPQDELLRLHRQVLGE